MLTPNKQWRALCNLLDQTELKGISRFKDKPINIVYYAEIKLSHSITVT